MKYIYPKGTLGLDLQVINIIYYEKSETYYWYITPDTYI